nr:MobF family relaxase [aff. Roholtiella sp. LEGE 12411]
MTAKNVSAKTAVEYFFRGASQKGAARWSGEAAQKLGLSGAINNEKIFTNIAHGFSPDGSRFLNGRKLNNDKRRSALDCTFSAPKTISLMALVGGDYRLIEAHIKAVKQSLNVAEPIYARARIRSDGKQKPIDTGNLLVAEFDHIESRELDPQLHTHCLLMNMTEANGKWYSLSNSQVFKNKAFLGMTYQSFLAAEVKKLGYEVEAKEHGQFDIKGFSEQEIKAFSKRRQKILAQVGESASRAERDRAWNTTRKHKKDVTQSELKADWRQQAAALEIIFELPAYPEYEPVEEIANNKSLESALDQAIAHWSERNVSFKHEDLGKFILQERLASNVTEIDSLIKQHKDLIDLPGMPGHYTTWRAVETEVAIIDLMQSGQDKLNAIANPQVIENRLEQITLNDGQRQAVQLAATTSDQFVAWQGVAGAGKTFAVNQLKAIATDAGYTVKGFAPNSIATKVLGQDTGIKTRNVASLLCSKLPPEPELNQLWIIDEAGLLSASDAHALLERAVQEQARVVFIGDTKQFSSVGAGNPFKLLQQEGIKTAHLTESRRQQNPDLKLAVDLIADNRIQSGFRHLQAMGSIVHVSPEEKLEIIANEYMAVSPEARSQTLVLAGTNKERLALTQAIRSKLHLEGSLGQDTIITQLIRKDLTKVQMENLHNFEMGEVVMPTRDYKRRGLAKGQLYTVVGKQDKTLILQGDEGNKFEVDTKFEKAVYKSQKIAIAVGDLLRWRKNDNDLGRSNGEDFVITGIDGDTATIKYLESDGRVETLNLREEQSLDYAIVSTIYSSQGKTAGRVLVADDGWAMTKESFYVAASRAKQELKIYTHDPVDMLKRVEDSKTKQNALEVLREQVKEKQAAERATSVVEQPVRKTQATVCTTSNAIAPPILLKDLPAVTLPVVPAPVLKTPSSISQPVIKPVLKKETSIEVPVAKPVLKKLTPQQNQTKEKTHDITRQQPNRNTTINREDRRIDNKSRETERKNRAVRNESSRELERVQSQSLELLAAISRYVEQEEIEQLGANIERINRSFTDGWLRGQRTANLSASTLRQNSATIDRTESYGHLEQRDSEQLLNAIADFLETRAIESTNIVKDLQTLTEKLGHYQDKDSVRAIVLDVAAGITDFIDQSAVEAALVKGLPRVTEQLSQYQQQLASAKTTFNQLEQLLINKPVQNQALEAIAEYVELQSVETFGIELSKFVTQLKQLPQPKITSNDIGVVASHSLQDTQQNADNLLRAISEYLEQDAIASSPTVSVLDKLMTQLRQSQSHANRFINQFDVAVSASLRQLNTLLLKQQQQIEKQFVEAFSQHIEQSTIQSESIIQAFEIIKESLSIPSDNTRVIQQIDTVISYYIELINKVNQLSDQEFLLLKQNVVDYFQKQPLYPPFADKQLLQNEIEQINTRIQNLWQEQVKYVNTANQLEKKLFYKWDQKYTKTVAKIEQTAGFIDSLTAHKQQKEIELKQWNNQAQIYCIWEQEPRTAQMRIFNQVFQLPLIQERLRDIQQKQVIKVQSQKQRPSVPRL